MGRAAPGCEHERERAAGCECWIARAAAGGGDGCLHPAGHRPERLAGAAASPPGRSPSGRRRRTGRPAVLAVDSPQLPFLS
eukprot:scaffold1114_cov124-Isochrysis_galbana.AAC.2